MSSILTIGFAMESLIKKYEAQLFAYFRKVEVPLARIALFTVYFWFGALKAAGMSPATPLIQELHLRTISFIPFPEFYGAFSLFEILIGALFLLRGMEYPAILLAAAHLVMTILPLVFLPHITWQGVLAPTLEGQYLIKNILIAALAVVVGAHARSRSGDPTAERL